MAVKFDEAALQGQPEALSVSAARATGFVSNLKPVKLGEEWTIDYKAEKDKDVLAGKATYKVTGKETVDGVECAVVEMTYKETGNEDEPLSTVGKHWIGLSSGESIKSVINVTNLPTPSGTAKKAVMETEVVK